MTEEGEVYSPSETIDTYTTENKEIAILESIIKTA